MSRTLSLGLPNKPDCHEGLGYPSQLPLTTPGCRCRPSGAAARAAAARDGSQEETSPVELLQKPLEP